MKSTGLCLTCVAAVLLLATAIAPAGAQLAPISYGFPSVFNQKDVTAFTRDILSTTNFEDAAVTFSGGGCGVGGFGIGFPTIVQTSEQTMYAEHTDFFQSHEVTAINYPYLSLGGCATPYTSGIPFLDGYGF